MNKILLHIPHSSTKLPKEFWQNICTSKQIIEKFVKDITDVDTGILFASNEYDKIIFPYSRVFCDVEKFADDNLEVMSKFGMGAIYSQTNFGVKFRNYNKEYNNKILHKYYYPYHEMLNRKVESLLRLKENVVLVDCHSFSKNIIMIEENKDDLPEICIGFNGEKDKLAKLCEQYFKNLKYNVKSNYPYPGTMVPNDYIDNPNAKLKSIMIEINKEIYVNNKDNFARLQKDINELLRMIEFAHLD